MKHIFVTGGVVSGLGKGITAASLGRLLKARGYKVASQKLDPYINVDPGTMSPYQHGEVYVTEDGAETDLDLGHYERFIDEDLNRYSNLTTGKVYANVLRRERQGGYLGKTVQTIPHITDEIKRFIYRVGEHSDADIVITEIGGTIGDIESQPFLEAIRQVGREVGRITDETIFDKIANFCNVDRAAVIENLTLPVLYEAPLYLEQAHFSEIVCQKLDLPARDIDLSSWRAMVDRIHASHEEVTIALVGKYTQLHDAYLSIVEALHHAGYARGVQVRIRWIDSEAFVPTDLAGVDGVLVPGGFGSRGIEGMIEAVRCARERDLPYLGICLGMQVMCIEYARNVVGWPDANSGEFDPESPHKVIDFMPGQSDEVDKGGTLRLGSYPCEVQPGTTLHRYYALDSIAERHRHRYELNNEFRQQLLDAGLTFSGLSPDGRLVEAAELTDRPFFVGVQYHPEFKSRPTKPHPLFLGLVEAAQEHKQNAK